MSPERLSQLAAAYGGDLRRWPESERLAVGGLLSSEPALRTVVASEDALDTVLAEAPCPRPSAALRTRLAAAAPTARRTLERVWNWWSGVGLAGACAAGVALGLAFNPMPAEEPTTLAVLSPYDPVIVAELQP